MKIILLAFTFFIATQMGAQLNYAYEFSQITDPLSSSNDGFGKSVKREGNYLFVGMPYNDSLASNNGAVGIYKRTSSSSPWYFYKKIVPSDVDASAAFGGAIAVSGDYLVVGASKHGGYYSEYGAVYIFSKNQGGFDNWGEVKKIQASSLVDDSYFGASLDIDGTKLIVGASGSKRAYLFEKDFGGINNWGETKVLTSSSTRSFGQSVAIHNDLSFVGGGWYRSYYTSNSGRVTVFSKDEGGLNNWGNVKELEHGNNTFGAALDYDGVTLAVTSVRYTGTGASNYPGRCYLFKKDEGGVNNWGVHKTIQASNVSSLSYFGRSISIDGSNLLIGATNSQNKSQLYFLNKDEGGVNNWGEKGLLLPSDGHNNDSFYGAPFVLGTELYAGASGATINGQSRGKVYRYSPDSCFTTFTFVSDTIYYDEVVSFGGSLLNQEGQYNDTLSSVNGCDSIVILNLAIKSRIKFDSKWDFATGNGTYDVDLGDLNGDGKLDMVTANYSSNTISIFQSQATQGVINPATFIPSFHIPAGVKPTGVEVVDVDGDGKKDIVVTAYTSDSLFVFRNVNTGGFLNASSFAPKVGFQTGNGPIELEANDLDNNGKIDLVVINEHDNTVSVFANYSTPGNIFYATKLDYPSNYDEGFALSVGDITNDGKKDILVTVQSGDVIYGYENNGVVGGISFKPYERVTYNGGNPGSTQVYDFDNDGCNDIFQSFYKSGYKSYVYKNSCATGDINPSNYNDNQVYSYSSSGAYGFMTRLSDLDLDGKKDAVFTSRVNSSTGKIHALANTNNFDANINSADFNGQSTKTYGTSFSSHPAFVGSNRAVNIRLGDIDNDGLEDLCVINYGGNKVMVFKNITTINPALNDTIATNISGGTTFCGGDSLVVSFTSNSVYNSGNNFVVQLSDALGSFDNPTSIGEVNSTTVAPLSGIIPGDVSSGAQYRVRIVSTNPTVVGGDNGGDLVVNEIRRTNLENSICQGDSVLFAGAYLKNAGNYSDTLTSNTGCDSIVNYELSVMPSYLISVAQNICTGDSVLFGGVYRKTTGSYTFNYGSINGCDSTILMNLTVQPFITSTQNEVICGGDSVMFGGNYVGASGVYYDTVNVVGSCDSVYLLNLQVNASYAIHTYDTIMEGDTLTAQGQQFSIAGVYETSYLTTLYCDSIIYSHLYVKQKQCDLFEKSLTWKNSKLVDVVVRANGNNLLIANASGLGGSMLIEISPLGDTVWTKQLMFGNTTNLSHVAERQDGKIVVAGYGGYYGAVFALLDPVGNLIQHQGYKSSVSSRLNIRDMIVAPDNSIYFVGEYKDIYSGGVTYYEWFTPFIAKLNSDLSSSWMKSYSSHTYSNRRKGNATSLKMATDGNIVFTGTHSTASNGMGGYYYVAKVSPSGSFVWRKQRALSASSVANNSVGIESTATGDIYMAHNVSDVYGGRDFVVEKLNSSGVSLWVKSYGTASNDYLTGIKKTLSDEVLLVGVHHDGVQNNAFLMKVDVSGGATFSKYYDVQQSSLFNDVAYTSNHKILALGSRGGNKGYYVQTELDGTGTCSVQSLILSSGDYSAALVNGANPNNETYQTASVSPSVLFVAPQMNTLCCFPSSVCVLQSLFSGPSTVCLNDNATFTNNSIAATGYTWKKNGVSISANSDLNHIFDSVGVFQLELIATNGVCFDTLVSSVSVLQVDSVSISNSICQGSNYVLGTQTLTTSGTYSETFTSITGCDSVVTLALTVNPVQATSTSASICQGSNYVLGTQTLTTSGTYSETFTSITGCDSVVTLALTVNPVQATSTSASICQGSNYVLGTQTLTTSGTYSETFTSMTGCDSVVTLALTVNPVQATSTSASICQGSNYVLGTQTLTTSGTYSETFTSITGCDSVVTLALTVNPVQATSTSASICQGSNYVLGTQTLTTSGTYSETFTSITGCDSVVTLALTVNPVQATSTSASICQGSNYVLGTQTLTTSGTYSETFTSITGCDSVVTLALTVNPVQATSTSASICQGSNYVLGTQTLTTSGTYSETFTSITGCDSVVTLALTVNPVQATSTSASICQGSNYVLGTQTLTTSGTYSETFTSITGCDSVVTLALTVNPVQATSTSASICQGSNYVLGTQTLTTSGTYSETFTSITGCDSVVTLALTVNPVQATSTSASICQGSNYVLGTQTLTTSGTYSETFTSITGCDSVVTLALTVNPVQATSTSASICQGSNYVLGTQTLTTSGTYSETFTSMTGCDSVVTLALTVNPVQATSTSESICQGSNYVLGTQTLTTSGTYSETFTSITGCDSVVTLALTVNPVQATSTSASICQGSNYVLGTQTLTTSGTYSETFTSITGCDSVVTLALNVEQTLVNDITVNLCDGDSLLFDGGYLLSGGLYVDTLQAVSSCDSVVNLTLIINPLFDTVVDMNLCDEIEYQFGSQLLVSSGAYTETFTSATGCDSIVTLNIEFNEGNDTVIVADICEGEEYVLGTQVLTDTGTYSEVFFNAEGCDSVVTLTLNVKVLPTITIEFTDGEFIATEGVSYQWYLDGDALAGEINREYAPVANGVYTVEVLAFNGCGNSADFNLQNVGVEEEIGSKIKLMPNPSDGLFSVGYSQSFNLEIYNAVGELVYFDNANNHSRFIDLSLEERGVYFLRLVDNDGVVLVVEKLILN